MTVPAVPFYASTALAEWGLGSGHYMGELIGRPNAPTGAYYLSSLAGLSNVVVSMSPGDQVGSVGSAASANFTFYANSNVGVSSYSWGLSTDSGAASIVAGGGSGDNYATVRMNASGGYAHTVVSCTMSIAGGSYGVSAVCDYTRDI